VSVIVFPLCAFVSILVSVMLLRAYSQRKLPLLLWSGWCFVFLTLSNVFLFLDLVVFPSIDFRPYRLLTALAGIAFLLYSFIWEAE